MRRRVNRGFARIRHHCTFAWVQTGGAHGRVLYEIQPRHCTGCVSALQAQIELTGRYPVQWLTPR